MIERRNMLHQDISKILGFNVEVECELLNIAEDDYQEVSLLVDQIENSRDGTAGGTHNFTIYPSYWHPDGTANAAGNIELCNMRLDSSFTAEQLHSTEVAQSIKLKFVGKDLYTTIPENWFTRGDAVEYWIDDVGDFLVDDVGDGLYFQVDDRA